MLEPHHLVSTLFEDFSKHSPPCWDVWNNQQVRECANAAVNPLADDWVTERERWERLALYPLFCWPFLFLSARSSIMWARSNTCRIDTNIKTAIREHHPPPSERWGEMCIMFLHVCGAFYCFRWNEGISRQKWNEIVWVTMFNRQFKTSQLLWKLQMQL